VSPLIVIFVTVFIDLIGFGIIIPLLPFYAEAFGASALVVGLLSMSFSLMQFLFAPLWGRLSDVVGRRPVILIGLGGSAVSYLLFGLATSLPMLFVARCLAGIAGANIPTAQAFIADTTTPENRAKGMGLIGAAFGLGFIFGPAIGGFLSRWGYATPFFFAAALSAANLLAAIFLLPEPLPPERRGASARVGRVEGFRRALARPGLPLMLLVFFVIITAFSSFEAMFALFSEVRFGFQAATIGYLFAWVGIVLALVQGVLVGRIVRWVGERRLVPIALLTVTASLGATALASNVPQLVVALGLLAAGMGLQSPSMMSVISQLAHREGQGSTLGVSQSLSSLGRIIGPIWGGWIFDRFGHAAPIYWSAGLMLVAVVLSVIAFAGYHPDPGEADLRDNHPPDPIPDPRPPIPDP
jgi:DHA1 family tetracycline resistance protein-like MFS transporter